MFLMFLGNLPNWFSPASIRPEDNRELLAKLSKIWDYPGGVRVFYLPSGEYAQVMDGGNLEYHTGVLVWIVATCGIIERNRETITELLKGYLAKYNIKFGTLFVNIVSGHDIHE